MRIERLDISNFRGILSGSVKFSDRTILIGDNNAGKTTILEAIALLLGRDRMVRRLTEHDFFGSNPQPTDRIRLIATLGGFDQNDPTQHPDWFRASRGIEKWISATDGTLKPIKENDADQLAVQIALDARFDAQSLDVETIRYFYDADDTGDPFDEERVTALPAHLIRDLGFFLVPASRSWDRMMSFGSELFRRVINYMGGKPATAVLKARNELRSPDPELQDDPNIVDVIQDINADLKSIIGKDAELKLRITQGDSLSILNAMEPHFQAETGQTLPAARHGAGLISLQSLVLLLRFGHVRARKGDPFILSVEEPELHVPPPLQRRIAQKIQSLTSQSILTTHSPIVASHGRPTDIILVRNDKGNLTSTPLIEAPLTNASNNVERRLLQSGLTDTVTALMHPLLLIPEGRIDRDFLSLLATGITSADSHGLAESAFGTRVGILATPDARMRDALNLLYGVHGRIGALVDGDQAGNDHLTELLTGDVPSAIVQWPQGWAMEQLIGWVVEADNAILTNPELLEIGMPQTVAEAVDELGRNTNAGGLKGNLVVMEALTNAICQSEACRTRVKTALDALHDAIRGTGEDNQNLQQHPASTEVTNIWIFEP